MKRELWHVPCGVERERNDLQWLCARVALKLQSKYAHDKNIQTWKSSWFYSISEYFPPSTYASRYFRSLIGLIVSKLCWINAHQTPLLSCFSIVRYERNPYRTVGTKIKTNFKGIHAFSWNYINIHAPSKKLSSITRLKMSCFSQNLVVADLAIAGKYEVISDNSFSNRVQRKTLWQGIPQGTGYSD